MGSRDSSVCLDLRKERKQGDGFATSGRLHTDRESNLVFCCVCVCVSLFNSYFKHEIRFLLLTKRNKKSKNSGKLGRRRVEKSEISLKLMYKVPNIEIKKRFLNYSSIVVIRSRFHLKTNESISRSNGKELRETGIRLERNEVP